MEYKQCFFATPEVQPVRLVNPNGAAIRCFSLMSELIRVVLLVPETQVMVVVYLAGIAKCLAVNAKCDWG
ncbi:hypothetical protein CWO84_05725 [Methylomonas sp. Kb3]|uniref:hypothetical protein n=1 Tax=Methylomonas sp. Kb3 TaxID=1611544 RepID=UPI000C32F236|nr:hypothetical protein [Methylomonas sp. Kb3]PKD41203.1 hypothetical protein CWO84_05725 [Methylomonas sp. Kb3]